MMLCLAIEIQSQSGFEHFRTAKSPKIDPLFSLLVSQLVCGKNVVKNPSLFHLQVSSMSLLGRGQGYCGLFRSKVSMSSIRSFDSLCGGKLVSSELKFPKNSTLLLSRRYLVEHADGVN